MDIMLERIMSLLPRKPDGKFVRGAKKDFALSIGYDSGDIVSMWLNGSSESYKGKVHEIAAKYNVSVEWLQGKTDKKEKPTHEGEQLSEITMKLIERIKRMDMDQQAATLLLLNSLDKQEG